MINDKINPTMGFGEWFLIIILSIIWGGSFFFVEIAIKELTPITLVMLRVGIASLSLVFYVYLTGEKMPGSPGVWVAFFIMGAINNLVPFYFIAWAQTHIESSLASILNATTPMFSVVMAHFLTQNERMTPNRLTGVVVGWFGVIILIGIESLRGFGTHVMGQIAVLTAAFLYACAAIYARRFKDIPPVVVAAGMLCGSTVLSLPLAFILEQPFQLTPSIPTLFSILALAILSTSLAYIIYFRLLAKAGVTNSLLVTFLIPISAIFLGVFILGERPGWNAFIGMGLIFIGLIAIDGRLLPSIIKKTSPLNRQ